MKKLSVSLALLLLTTWLVPGQKVEPISKTNKPLPIAKLPVEASYAVTERGAHHSVWQRVTAEVDGQGAEHFRTNSYTELATGLNFQNERGAWEESKEEIEILPKGAGAIARHGQHKVIFPPDIYDGQIELQTSQGQWLRSRVLGLGYFDTESGKSVFIAETTNSVGELHGSNVVIYPEAFTDIRASLRLTYTKAGFEQDIILLEQPPSSEKFGLNPETTRLQVFTEFFNPPQPDKQERELKDSKGGTMTDELLDFGALQMVPGKVFSLDPTNSVKTIPVVKQWLKLEGRDFLIEEVEVKAVAEELKALPKARNASLPAGTNGVRQARLGKPALPARREAVKKPGSKPMRMAQASAHRKGFVLDYTTINTGQANYTFQGDSTYYITGPVTLSGTTTFEGGAVIKYAQGASLTVSAVNSQATSYRPVVFTAKDDDSVGEMIGGSTHTLVTGTYYANPALSFSGNGGLANWTLSNFRIACAQTAIAASSVSYTLLLSHGQIVNCSAGLNVTYAGNSVDLRNMLFAKFNTAINASYANVHAENVTFDAIPQGPPNYSPSFLLLPAGGPPNTMGITLKNCILANVNIYSPANPSAVSGDHNGFFNSGYGSSVGSNPHPLTSPFQTVGAGNYYLTATSGAQNNGLASINATLADELKKKTTYPPANPPAANYAGTIWNQTALRDTDTPDLGYHYDPLDYWCSGYSIGIGRHTLSSGVAVGLYGASGFIMGMGPGILSEGRPDKMNHLAWYPSVQEQPVQVNNITTAGSSLFNIGTTAAGIPKIITLKFTDISMQGLRQAFFSGGQGWGFGDIHNAPYITLNDCWLRGVKFQIDAYSGSSSPPGSGVWMQNNLLERCTVGFYNGAFSTTFQNPLDVRLCNNLFWRCTSAFNYQAQSATYLPTWNIQDNLFETNIFTFWGNGSYTSYVVRENNGFFSANNPLGGNNTKMLTSLAYATGPFGSRYIASSTPTLIDAGSRTAAAAGLFFHTIKTSNVKEGSEPPPTIVDIGFHYVAVNPGTSLPYDVDNNGIWDYNEGPPVITFPGSVTYTENASPVRLSDPANQATLTACVAPNGGNMTVNMMPSATGNDSLGVRTEGVGAGQISLIPHYATGTTGSEGQPIPGGLTFTEVAYGGTAFGTVTGGSGAAPLVVSFYATSTATTMAAAPAAVLALIRNLTYQDTSENPATPPRSVRVILNEADGRTCTATRSVSVVPVNDPPYITFLTGALPYVRGSKEVWVWDQDASGLMAATVNDVDSTAWNGGSLTADFQTTTYSAEEIIAVRNQGTGTGQIGVSGNSITYENVAIGTFTGGTPGTALTVTFNSAANLINVQALVRNLTYQNISASPADPGRALKVSLSEGPAVPLGEPRVGPDAYKAVQLGCPNQIEVMVVFDRSGSMAGASLDSAKDAAANLLNFLRPTVDRVGLISFSSSIDSQWNQPLTQEFNLVRNEIGGLPAGGATAIGEAINAARAQLAASPRFTTAGSVIVLLSDGVSNVGTDPILAAAEAKKLGIRLITVALGAEAQATLSAIASTPADFHSAVAGGDLCAQYIAIGQSLCRDSDVWVDAGPDQTVFTGTATLAGSLNGNLCNAVANWVTLSGSGSANFASGGSARTTVTLNRGPGRYLFQLNATKNSVTWSDQVTVTWINNNAPVVDVGPDRILDLSNTGLTVTGKATDDWTTEANLAYQWLWDSSPAGFTRPTLPPGKDLNLVGQLPAGEYTLTLTVSDGVPTDPPFGATDDFKLRVTDMRGRTWTRDADFEEGRGVDVDYDRIPDTLTFSARGTSSRQAFEVTSPAGHGNSYLDTLDSDTGELVSRHGIGASSDLGGPWAVTGWPWFGTDGSLTTASGETFTVGRAMFSVWGMFGIDGNGDPEWEGAYGPPAILKFGTVTGGTRVDENGSPDLQGDYLAPPYKYNTCMDRTGGIGGTPDGRLKIPRGPFPASYLDWVVTPLDHIPTSPEQAQMLSQAQDEGITGFRILQPWLSVIRSVHQDIRGDIWVGGITGDISVGIGSFRLLRLDSVTLDVLNVVDPPGWQTSSIFGEPLSAQLVGDRMLISGFTSTVGDNWMAFNLGTRTVESTGTLPEVNNSYWQSDMPRLTVHPTDGTFWYTHVDPWTVFRATPSWSLDPMNGVNVGDFEISGSIQFGRENDVWLGGSRSAIARVDGASRVMVGQLTTCTGARNLAADSRGRIWAPGNDWTIDRINPKRGKISDVSRYPIGVVDLHVEDLGWGFRSAVPNSIPQNVGIWTAVHDCEIDDQVAVTTWGKVTWTVTDVSTGATLLVQARAAASQLALAAATWHTIDNPGDSLSQPGHLIQGRFVEFRVTFHRGTSGTGPVLEALTVMPQQDPGTPELAIPTSGEIAVDDEFTINRGAGELMCDVRANDKFSDELSFVSFSAPANGSVRIDGGQIKYTPSPNFYGEDRFSYTVSGPAGLYDRGLVKIKVASSPTLPNGQPPVDDNEFIKTYGPLNVSGDCNGSPEGNRPPLTMPDTVTMLGRLSAAAPQEECAIPVIANDRDPDRDDHVYLVDDYPRRTTFGWVRKEGDVLKYLPGVAAFGTDTFTYTALDEHGAQTSESVSVQVTPASPPTIEITSPDDDEVINNSATIIITANITEGQVDTSLLSHHFFDGISFSHLLETQTGPLPAVVNPKVVKVELFANSKSLGVADPPETGIEWTFNWQKVPLGVHNITVVATDEIGSIGVSDPVIVIVSRTGQGPDNAPPVAEITQFAATGAPDLYHRAR